MDDNSNNPIVAIQQVIPTPESGASDPNRPLARNSACHQCRRRKLKCNAVRPTCNNCARPRQRRVDNSRPPEPCTWDEPKEPSARTMRKRAAEARRASGTDKHNNTHNHKDHSDNGNTRDGSRVSRSSSPKREGVSKRDRLDRMESRINELQTSLRQSIMTNPFAPASVMTASEPLKPQSNNNNVNYHSINNSMNPTVEDANTLLNLPNFVNNYNKSSNGTNDGLMSWLDDLPQLSGTPADLPPVLDSNTSPSKANNIGAQTILESGVDKFHGDGALIWPDWPKDLPTLSVVEHVMGVFFERVPTLPKMLHRQTLKSSLRLPPSHPDFPETALLHAILAATAPFLSLAFLADRSSFPVGTSLTAPTHPEFDFESREPNDRTLLCSFRVNPERLSTPLERFQYWHRRKALIAQGDGFNRGRKFLQTTQALVIATSVDQMNGWWTDLWVETGNCVRMSVPLKLHESPNVPIDALKLPMNSLLGPASSPIDQAERDRTWWMIFVCERLVSGSTSWPSCISDVDITVELPVTQEMFDSGVGNLTGTQTLHSPRFLSNHPPEHLDSFCLLIKSVKLYYDTNVFLRSYMRGSHVYSRFMSDPTLRKLLADIHSFRISFPHHMRRPAQRMADGRDQVDPDLFGALTMTHCCALTLGEPMIGVKTWSEEAAKMSLSAVRAILSLIYDVSATSFDITLLPNLVSYSWGLAGKCLVRFMKAASATGDHVAASVFSSELQVFRGALTQYGAKHPLGVRHLKIVDSVLAAEGTDVPYECTIEDILDADYIPSAAAKPSNYPTPQATSTPAQSSTGSSSLQPSSLPSTSLTPSLEPSKATSLFGSGSDNNQPGSQGQSPNYMGTGIGNGNGSQTFQQGFYHNLAMGAGLGVGEGTGSMGGVSMGGGSMGGMSSFGGVEGMANVGSGNGLNLSSAEGLGPTTPSAWMTAIDESFDISSFAFDVGALERLMGIDQGDKAGQ